MHNCIALKVMQQRGWQEVEEEYEWDIFWYIKPVDFSSSSGFHVYVTLSILRSFKTSTFPVYAQSNRDSFYSQHMTFHNHKLLFKSGKPKAVVQTCTTLHYSLEIPNSHSFKTVFPYHFSANCWGEYVQCNQNQKEVV